MPDPAARPFSVAWTVIIVVLFLVVEATIGSWLGPMVIGKYVSPMFHFQVQLLLHLVSFYLGGFGVGMISPGRRLAEPAVGAFISVGLVFAYALFMPSFFFMFDVLKLLLAGGIAFVTALAGAWHGESVMGNIAPDAPEASETRRGRLRASLWSDDAGLLSPKTKGRDR